MFMYPMFNVHTAIAKVNFNFNVITPFPVRLLLTWSGRDARIVHSSQICVAGGSVGGKLGRYIECLMMLCGEGVRQIPL